MKYVLLYIVGFLLFSCNTIQIRKKSDASVKRNSNVYSSSTKTVSGTTYSTTSNSNSYSGQSDVVIFAKQYIGTPYKSGGTNSSGMDCSGLVYTSFAEKGIKLPRVSRDQANAGEHILKENAKSGDLIFFNTSGSGISHVGIVEKIENGEIFFIHSSSSKGVIVSSLESSYWKPRFVKIVRVN